MRAVEPLSEHPLEAQVWGVRTRLGLNPLHWVGFLLSAGIRLFTIGVAGGRYSHLLLRIGDEIWEAAESGVRRGFAMEYDDPAWIVDAFALPFNGAQRDELRAAAEAYVGTPYDLVVNLRIALRELGLPYQFLPEDGDRSLNCSGFVDLACVRVGWDLLPGTPIWRYTPAHVVLSARRGRVVKRGRVLFDRPAPA